MMTEKPLKRRDLSSTDFKIELEDNRRNWRTFNVPVELISKYISYAKLHYNNEVWKVMEQGMELILERDRTSFTVADKVKNLEAEISALKSLLYAEKEKETKVNTFGGY